MADQPTGLVALLFSDIEGSTKLLDRLGPDTYATSLDLHRTVVRTAADRYDAYEVAYEGDSFFFAFADAGAALAAAAEAQRELATAEWPEDLPFRVRMGVHAGEVLAVPPKYVGLEVHRAARIMAAAHGGQVVVSDAALKLAGADGLDLGEHRLKDLLQPIRLYQLRVGSTSDHFPPLRSLEERPTNLPIQPNDLIGRRRELAELSALLTREDVRLVTLVGVGGAGKTRLAVQAAAEVSDRFPAGVFVVFLASLRDPELVPGAIADALGVRQAPGATLEESLAEYLRDRELLLVLDNFEQVGPAATLVATLLEECRGLRVLTTSRTRLRLRAEHLYDVPPLTDDDAVELLLARIEAGRHGRDTGLGKVEELRQISRALDGLPLALELAAPLLEIYEPDDLLARMDHRLELLADGPLDLSERQRTLRAAIEWSHELLSPEARELFAQSSVFVGGASLEALEAVGGRDTRALAALIDGSLARVEHSRLLLLETIREYAAERLEQSGRGDETRTKHAHFILELAGRELERGRVRNEEDALEVFELEHDNLRAALAFFEQHDPVSMLDLATRCSWFWYIRCHWHEGRRWFEAAVARVTQPVERKLWARALNGIGILADRLGDTDTAERSWTEALEIAREDQNLAGMSNLLLNLGNTASTRGDLAGARALYAESLTVARKTDDAWNCVVSLYNLGELEFEAEDYSTAESHLLEVLELAKESGIRFGQTIAENLLGAIALAHGDVVRAAALQRSSLQLARELEIPDAFVNALTEVALLAVDLADPEAGAYLLGAAEGVRVRQGLEHHDPIGRAARAEGAIRDLLDADTYAERFGAGVKTDEAEALAFSLARIFEPAEASAKR